jgi:hypothetical protein
MSKSVSITCVGDDHIQWGTPVAGSIHVEEFVEENLMGGQFFKTLDEAFAHIREYLDLENSVVLTHNEIN